MTPISCDNPHCHLPSARIINGTLIIESRHHGEVHRCTISLHWLQNLLTNCDKPVLQCTATTVPVLKTPPP